MAFARQAARSRGTALCSACVEVLSVGGVGITVVAANNSQHLCASNSMVAALEDIQFTTGEGPARDAFRERHPVQAPCLDRGAGSRWPSFVDVAAQHGVCAVFAFPLVAFGANVGVMSLYQLVEGDLTVSQSNDSLALISVLTETILGLQSEGNPTPALEDAVAYRSELHQASGMVAVQLRVLAAEAMLRIRVHAFVTGQSVATVAAAIVSRRLRLDNDLDDHSIDTTGGC